MKFPFCGKYLETVLGDPISTMSGDGPISEAKLNHHIAHYRHHRSLLQCAAVLQCCCGAHLWLRCILVPCTVRLMPLYWGCCPRGCLYTSSHPPVSAVLFLALSTVTCNQADAAH